MIKVERCSENNISATFFALNLSFLLEYEDEHEVEHSMSLKGDSSVPQLVPVLPREMARGQSAVTAIFADFLYATLVAKHGTLLGGFCIPLWGDSNWILSESAAQAILGLDPQEKLVAAET